MVAELWVELSWVGESNEWILNNNEKWHSLKKLNLIPAETWSRLNIVWHEMLLSLKVLLAPFDKMIQFN